MRAQLAQVEEHLPHHSLEEHLPHHLAEVEQVYNYTGGGKWR